MLENKEIGSSSEDIYHQSHNIKSLHVIEIA